MNRNGVATNYNGATTAHTGDTVHRHRLARIVLYALLFISSIILLGLTAARIDYTRKFFGGFESVIVELLVTSILTFIISLLVIRELVSRVIGFMGKIAELATLGLIWLMSLVGAAIVSNDWMNSGFCISAECHILDAIKAFSWIIFCLTTILAVLRLVNWRRDHSDARLEKGTRGTAPATTGTTV